MPNDEVRSEVSPNTEIPTTSSLHLDRTLAVPITPLQADLTPGMVFGTYRIVEKLGEGGMGAVYRALHIKLDKVMALKILPAAKLGGPDSIARFERETRAAGRLNHPNIVQAFDAGEVDGTHYLAMEHVEGSDLAKLVQTKGPLAVRPAGEVIRQAALALAAAHSVSLVHRDIKPSNLIMDRQGRVRVLDLGLALLGDRPAETKELTLAGSCFGTPDYMAPEQWDDSHAVDGRADLYALGCTLYFLLTGRAPYDGDSHKSVPKKMLAHLRDPAPSLMAACPNVPEALEAIYQRLMAKEPAARFQTATELSAALEKFLAGSSAGSATRLETADGPAVSAAFAASNSPSSASVRGFDWARFGIVGTFCVLLLGATLYVAQSLGTKPQATEKPVTNGPDAKTPADRLANLPRIADARPGTIPERMRTRPGVLPSVLKQRVEQAMAANAPATNAPAGNALAANAPVANPPNKAAPAGPVDRVKADTKPSPDLQKPAPLELGTDVGGRLGPFSETKKAHYWKLQLPAGEYRLILDPKRSDDHSSNVQAELTLGQIENAMLKEEGSTSTNDITVRTRAVLEFQMKTAGSRIVEIKNDTSIIDYRLGLFRKQDKFGIPFLVNPPPVKPLKLGEVGETGELEAETINQDAYFMVTIPEGDFWVDLEFKRVDGKDSNVGGSAEFITLLGVPNENSFLSVSDIAPSGKGRSKLIVADEFTKILRVRAGFSKVTGTIKFTPIQAE